MNKKDKRLLDDIETVLTRWLPIVGIARNRVYMTLADLPHEVEGALAATVVRPGGSQINISVSREWAGADELYNMTLEGVMVHELLHALHCDAGLDTLHEAMSALLRMHNTPKKLWKEMKEITHCIEEYTVERDTDALLRAYEAGRAVYGRNE